MYEILGKKEYKKSPSLWKDLWISILLLVVLTILVIAAGTSVFQKPVNIEYVSSNLASILNLFGTLFLSYEFITAIRNESNKNRLNQEIIKLEDHRISALSAIINEEDRENRVSEIDDKLVHLKADLNHEMKFSGRKFVMAWTGLFLITFGTLFQLWANA